LQSTYAADLLYIVNLCLVKLSVIVLLHNITPVKFHKRLGLVLGIVTVLWALSAVFATAFQCRLPNPWMTIGNRCYSRVSIAGMSAEKAGKWG
jgi:hypothetical protein